MWKLQNPRCSLFQNNSGNLFVFSFQINFVFFESSWFNDLLQAFDKNDRLIILGWSARGESVYCFAQLVQKLR